MNLLPHTTVYIINNYISNHYTLRSFRRIIAHPSKAITNVTIEVVKD